MLMNPRILVGGLRHRTGNKHSSSAQRANGIGFEAIGAYIKELEDYQNGTDFLARRLQVASQDASDAAHADEQLVPAGMWTSERCL
jgi:predicted DNA-binding protein